jgi:hypothetical protein
MPIVKYTLVFSDGGGLGQKHRFGDEGRHSSLLGALVPEGSDIVQAGNGPPDID